MLRSDLRHSYYTRDCAHVHDFRRTRRASRSACAPSDERAIYLAHARTVPQFVESEEPSAIPHRVPGPGDWGWCRALETSSLP